SATVWRHTSSPAPNWCSRARRGPAWVRAADYGVRIGPTQHLLPILVHVQELIPVCFQRPLPWQSHHLTPPLGPRGCSLFGRFCGADRVSRAAPTGYFAGEHV